MSTPLITTMIFIVAAFAGTAEALSVKQLGSKAVSVHSHTVADPTDPLPVDPSPDSATIQGNKGSIVINGKAEDADDKVSKQALKDAAKKVEDTISDADEHLMKVGDEEKKMQAKEVAMSEKLQKKSKMSDQLKQAAYALQATPDAMAHSAGQRLEDMARTLTREGKLIADELKAQADDLPHLAKKLSNASGHRLTINTTDLGNLTVAMQSPNVSKLQTMKIDSLPYDARNYPTKDGPPVVDANTPEDIDGKKWPCEYPSGCGEAVLFVKKDQDVKSGADRASAAIGMFSFFIIISLW